MSTPPCFACGQRATQECQYPHFTGYFCSDARHQDVFHRDMALYVQGEHDDDNVSSSSSSSSSSLTSNNNMPMDGIPGPIRRRLSGLGRSHKHHHHQSLMPLSLIHDNPFLKRQWTFSEPRQRQVTIAALELGDKNKVENEGPVLLNQSLTVVYGRDTGGMRAELDLEATGSTISLNQLIGEGQGFRLDVPAKGEGPDTEAIKVSFAANDGRMLSLVATYLDDTHSDTFWLSASDKKKGKGTRDIILTFKRRDKCLYTKATKTWQCDYFLVMVQFFM